MEIGDITLDQLRTATQAGPKTGRPYTPGPRQCRTVGPGEEVGFDDIEIPAPEESEPSGPFGVLERSLRESGRKIGPAALDCATKTGLPRAVPSRFTEINDDLAVVRRVMETHGEQPPEDIQRVLDLALRDISRRVRDAAHD